MKKVLLSVIAAIGFGMTASAQDVIETVGAADFSSDWGADARSVGDYHLSADGAYHFKFHNTNAGNGKTWHNYIMFAKDADNNEILVSRCDTWGWGNNHVTEVADAQGNDANFVSMTKDCMVDLNVYRKGEFVTFDATLTTEGGDVWHHKSYGMGATCKRLNLSIKVENAVVEILEANKIALPADAPFYNNVIDEMAAEGKNVLKNGATTLPIKISPNSSVIMNCTNENASANAWENLQILTWPSSELKKNGEISILRLDFWDNKRERNGMYGVDELSAAVDGTEEIDGVPFGKRYNDLMNGAEVTVKVSRDDANNYKVDMTIAAKGNTFKYGSSFVATGDTYFKFASAANNTVTINSIEYSNENPNPTGKKEAKKMNKKIGNGTKAIYNINGARQNSIGKGINIVVEADGSVKKVIR